MRDVVEDTGRMPKFGGKGMPGTDARVRLQPPLLNSFFSARCQFPITLFFLLSPVHSGNRVPGQASSASITVFGRGTSVASPSLLCVRIIARVNRSGHDQELRRLRSEAPNISTAEPMLSRRAALLLFAYFFSAYAGMGRGLRSQPSVDSLRNRFWDSERDVAPLVFGRVRAELQHTGSFTENTSNGFDRYAPSFR